MTTEDPFAKFNKELKVLLERANDGNHEAHYKTIVEVCVRTINNTTIDDTQPIHPDTNVTFADVDECVKLIPPQLVDNDIVAIGVHGAGSILPNGRHVRVKVTNNHLQSSIISLLNSAANNKWINNRIDSNGNKIHILIKSIRDRLKDRGNTTDNQVFCKNFVLLFDNVYHRFSGREHTLIHHILTNDDARPGTYLLPTTTAANRAYRKQSDFNDAVLMDFPKSSQWALLSDKSVLDHFVCCIADGVDSIPDADAPNVDRDDIRLLADKLVARFRDAGDKDSLHFSMGHSLDRISHCDSKLFEHTWADTGLESESRDTKEHDHLRAIKIIENATKVQRFLLFRAFCGKYFYIFKPKKSDNLTFCLTVGTTKPLSRERLSLWDIFSDRIQGNLEIALTSNPPEDPGNLYRDNEKTYLSQLIGSTKLETFTKRILDHVCKPKDLKKVDKCAQWLHGLYVYVQFATLLSDIAVHEGKRQRFDFLVGDGVFATRYLDILSTIESDSIPINTLPRSIDNGSTRKNDANALASLLLGNVSFFQSPNVVVYGDRYGTLHGLARAFRRPTNSVRVKRLDNAVAATIGTDAYLVRLLEDGDIQVYGNTKLLLWRRGESFIVPTMYGEEYQNALADILKKRVFDKASYQKDVLEVVARVVWKLSQVIHEGGCFVLYNGRSIDNTPNLVALDQINKRTVPLTDVLSFAENKALAVDGNDHLLEALAIQDGAVLVDVTNGKVCGRRQLVAAGMTTKERTSYMEALKSRDWPGWHKLLRWGTRHQSAVFFAHTWPKDCPLAVIIVSRDGDIHVFTPDGPIRDACYPPESD